MPVVHLRPEVAQKITVTTVFKVPGRPTPTTCRPPRTPGAARTSRCTTCHAEEHASRRGIQTGRDGKRGPMQFIEELKKKGHLVAYVGDVVGTGSAQVRHQLGDLGFTGETSRSCRTSASAA